MFYEVLTHYPLRRIDPPVFSEGTASPSRHPVGPRDRCRDVGGTDDEPTKTKGVRTAKMSIEKGGIVFEGFVPIGNKSILVILKGS